MLVKFIDNFNKRRIGVVKDTYFSKVINKDVCKVHVFDYTESKRIKLNYDIFVEKEKLEAVDSIIDWSKCRSVKTMIGKIKMIVPFEGSEIFSYGIDEVEAFSKLCDLINIKIEINKSKGV